MMGRLLSFDLKDQGIPLAMVHVSGLLGHTRTHRAMELIEQPGFLKTGKPYPAPGDLRMVRGVR